MSLLVVVRLITWLSCENAFLCMAPRSPLRWSLCLQPLGRWMQPPLTPAPGRALQPRLCSGQAAQLLSCDFIEGLLLWPAPFEDDCG